MNTCEILKNDLENNKHLVKINFIYDNDKNLIDRFVKHLECKKCKTDLSIISVYNNMLKESDKYIDMKHKYKIINYLGGARKFEIFFKLFENKNTLFGNKEIKEKKADEYINDLTIQDNYKDITQIIAFGVGDAFFETYVIEKILEDNILPNLKKIIFIEATLEIINEYKKYYNAFENDIKNNNIEFEVIDSTNPISINNMIKNNKNLFIGWNVRFINAQLKNNIDNESNIINIICKILNIGSIDIYKQQENIMNIILLGIRNNILKNGSILIFYKYNEITDIITKIIIISDNIEDKKNDLKNFVIK